MKKILIISILILTIIPIHQTVGIETLNYTYSIKYDNNTNLYNFSISFTNNITIYSVNMTVGNNTYILNGFKNSFYTIVPTNLHHEIVELHTFTSDGFFITSFQVQNATVMQIDMDTLAPFIFFIILLVLIAKYVLFYELKQ